MAYVSVSVHWWVLDDTAGNEGRGGLPNVSRQGCEDGEGKGEGRGGAATLPCDSFMMWDREPGLGPCRVGRRGERGGGAF